MKPSKTIGSAGIRGVRKIREDKDRLEERGRLSPSNPDSGDRFNESKIIHKSFFKNHSDDFDDEDI